MTKGTGTIELPIKVLMQLASNVRYGWNAVIGAQKNIAGSFRNMLPIGLLPATRNGGRQ
jgi:hypothetical protein